MTATTHRPRRGFDVAWMSRAACTSWSELPWTTDPQHIRPRDLQVMADVCLDCPALNECARYATKQRVTAGFWAGRHRDPCPPSLVAGPGWTTETLPGLGGLGGAA